MSAATCVAAFNQTGQPAMSVPLYWSNEGLPIGTQLAARLGDEATLGDLRSESRRHSAPTAKFWHEVDTTEVYPTYAGGRGGANA